MFAALGNGVFSFFLFNTALTAARAAGRVIIRARLLRREDAIERENCSDEPLRFDSSHLLSHVKHVTYNYCSPVMAGATLIRINLYTYRFCSEIGVRPYSRPVCRLSMVSKAGRSVPDIKEIAVEL